MLWNTFIWHLLIEVVVVLKGLNYVHGCVEMSPSDPPATVINGKRGLCLDSPLFQTLYVKIIDNKHDSGFR